MLTGPIRLDGALVGFASQRFAVEAYWEDESERQELAGGKVRTLDTRYRLRGSFGFETLTAVGLAQFKALTDHTFTLILRTKTGSDPDVPELEVLCRRVSPFEETGPLYNKSAGSNDVHYTTAIEFVSVDVASELPGSLGGGFSLEGTATVAVPGHGSVNVYDIEPFGDAALPSYEVDCPDGEGGTLTLTVHVVSPRYLTRLLAEPIEGDPFGVFLDTTGTYRLGTPKQDEP